MSNLNPGAFEFVPGKGFALPQRVQRQDPPQPTPVPATVSINIGAQSPSVAAPNLQQTPSRPSQPVAAQQPAPKPKSSTVKPTTAGSSRTFTTDKAKSDTSSVAKEVKAVADDEVLKDLYGDGSWISL